MSAARAQLSRPCVDFLKRLRFREGMGQCYLADAARGREVLVVPELRVDGPLARSAAYNGDTVRHLVGLGLIVVGDRLPPAQRQRYRYARHLDEHADRTVELTDAGREVLA